MKLNREPIVQKTRVSKFRLTLRVLAASLVITGTTYAQRSAGAAEACAWLKGKPTGRGRDWSKLFEWPWRGGRDSDDKPPGGPNTSPSEDTFGENHSIPTGSQPDPKVTPWMLTFASARTQPEAAGSSSRGRFRGDPTRAKFEAAWRSTSPEKRVILSYASADARHAVVVQQVLAKQEISTFLYQMQPGSRPDLEASEVRRHFDEASHYLVLDTSPAHRSAGGYVESLCARPLPAVHWDVGQHSDAERRLQEVLGRPAQVLRIMQRAPSAEIANLLTETVRIDSRARTDWLEMDDAGTRMAFEALLERPATDRQFAADAMRAPQSAAELRVLRHIDWRLSVFRKMPAASTCHTNVDTTNPDLIDVLRELRPRVEKHREWLRSQLAASADAIDVTDAPDRDAHAKDVAWHHILAALEAEVNEALHSLVRTYSSAPPGMTVYSRTVDL